MIKGFMENPQLASSSERLKTFPYDQEQDKGASFLFKDIYLFERVSKRESTSGGERQREEGEAGSQLSREPDTGLNPRTPGS